MSHLQEFGTPVWVLVEGQNLSKLKPKSESHTFVGFEDGPKAARYYNKCMHQVCISHNFQFPNKATETHPLIDSHEPLSINPMSEGELSQTIPNKVPLDHQDKNMGDGPKRTENEVLETLRQSKQPKTVQDY